MKINLELTIDQTNLVLSALSNLPFNQVVDVITNIRQQAETQVRENQQKTATYVDSDTE